MSRLVVMTEDQVRDLVRQAVAEARGVEAPTGPRFASLAEAATIARVHRKTVARWVTVGLLKTYRAGSRVRVRVDELEALLARDGKSEEGPDLYEIAARTMRHGGGHS